MKLESLPSNFKIPYLYDDKRLDTSNWTAMEIISARNLEVETKDGKFKPKTAEELFNFLTRYTCIFTYTPPGKNDALLRLLPDDELIKLSILQEAYYSGYTIRRTRSTLIVNKTPIINLISYTKNYTGGKLENVDKVANQLIESRNRTYGLYPIYTGASEARSLMLKVDEIKREMLILRKMGMEYVDKLDAACFGGRMETTGLGTSYQFHYDLIKSHLNILKEYPGLGDSTWVRGRETMKLFDKALPMSVYKIRTNVPRKFPFNPLPLRTEAGIKYPTGEIKGWYYKDYLTLLEELGIKFIVLDCLQYIGNPTYPFREHMVFLEQLIQYFELLYPDLEAKHLYATIAGSCKAIYKKLDKELSETQSGSRVYNPMVYGFVLTRQNTRIYRDALSYDAEALKVDSIATKSKKEDLHQDYKLKERGLTTYITPYLKSLPDTQPLYRQAIAMNSARRQIYLRVLSWNTLSTYTSSNITSIPPDVGLGEKYERELIIRPSYGTRKGTPIHRVGSLLRSWLFSTPSNGTSEENYGILQLAEFVRRFGNAD